MNKDISPYFTISLNLKSKPRRGGGNMFRHQVETFAILLEYGYTDPVLLKSALIHDIIEDGDLSGDLDFHQISEKDEDWPVVLSLVHEVSQRKNGGKPELKTVFLLRIMTQGSEKARVLKLADRISNLIGLPLTRDPEFMDKYVRETIQYIMPFSETIDPQMAVELKDRINSNLKLLKDGF